MAKFPACDEMTRRVAERALDEFLYQGKSIREWIRIIASEDAISRQAVIDMTGLSEWFDSSDSYNEFVVALSELPPVTPKQKIGRWIDDKCSVCGKGIEDLISSREWYRNEEPIFCPYCGARMTESEEI